MYDHSEDNADSGRAKIVRRRSDVRPVSPSFLQALGLMKITTGATTATSVPLSTSRRTGTDKNVARSHTSACKDKKRSVSKSVAASSTAKKTSVEKRGHVSKTKDRAEKRSHATSFGAPQIIPVVATKKTRKPAATTKPNTKKKPQDVEMQQHKASPPATKVSSTVKTAENLSESTCAVDEPRFWDNILESDFKSRNFTTLLECNKFTEKQIQALQKSFYCMSRMFCHRPRKHKRFMKTHECVECNFSISHECVRIDSSSYYTFGGVAPCVDFITPESTTMCSCNFTIFHSHSLKSKSKREAKPVVSSSPPSTSHLEENDRSVKLDCPTCCMTIFVSNRNNDICSNLTNFASTDGPIRNRFFRYVQNNVDYSPNNVSMSEFHSCSNDCCMLYHRCARDGLAGSFLPIQPHRPLDRCHPKESIESA